MHFCAIEIKLHLFYYWYCFLFVFRVIFIPFLILLHFYSIFNISLLALAWHVYDLYYK